MSDETSLHGRSKLGIYTCFIHSWSFERVEAMIHYITIPVQRQLFQMIDKAMVEKNLDTSKLKFVSFDGSAKMSSPTNVVYGLMKITLKLPHLI